MSDKFVSLHRHDSFSLFDGVDIAKRGAQKAASLDQSAIALTNHGNVFGLIDHVRWCKDIGVKPLLGMEAYVQVRNETTAQIKAEIEKGKAAPLNPSFHQTLLVQDYEGYRNLMRLITLSYDHFYYKPRVPLNRLKEYGAGLIVLSGCPSSYLHALLRTGKREAADKLFSWYKTAFGDRFFCEVQHHPKSAEVGKELLSLARKHGVRLVATNDAHYVDKEDRIVHDTLLRLRRKGQGEDNPTYGEGFHIVSRKEMRAYLGGAQPWLSKRDLDEALDSTVEIGERCSVEIPKPTRMLPPMWDHPQERLQWLSVKGLREKGLHKKREYVERLQRELDVVKHLDVSEYFHICHEVTTWGREHGILIGPRGSVCGSLMAFLLDITTVDPLVHGTIFERFLHEQKKSFPDVDLDIDSRTQDQVVRHVIEKYAPSAVPMVSFGRYASGNIVMDMERAFPDELNVYRRRSLRRALNSMKIVDRVIVMTEEDVARYPVFDEMEEVIPGFSRIVMKLYNMIRYMGRHPGGVAFFPSEHDQWAAKIVRDGAVFTSYSYIDIEYLGLLKIDFLGMGAITVLATTLDEIKERHKEQIALKDIPLDDKECFDRFAAADTDGIFQFETRSGRTVLREIEPDNFQELVAANALNRPGVSANITKYVAGKRQSRLRDSDEGEAPQPTAGQALTRRQFAQAFKAALRPTYGAIVYQEQITALLRALGFEWIECDQFLKGIKAQNVMYAASLEVATYGEPLVEKISNTLMGWGFEKEKGVELAERIKQYSFNRAHATGYSLVAYWEMWLRTHYPLEFWVSMLNAEGDEKKRNAYEAAAVYQGIALFPPHVNGSVRYRIEGNAIRVGLSTIKDVGDKAANAVIAGGPYETARQVRERVPKRNANRKVIMALIGAGALIMGKEKWEKHAVKYNVKRQEQGTDYLYIGYSTRRMVEKGTVGP